MNKIAKSVIAIAFVAAIVMIVCAGVVSANPLNGKIVIAQY